MGRLWDDSMEMSISPVPARVVSTRKVDSLPR